MSSVPKNPEINWLTCIGDSITRSDNANAFLSLKLHYPKLIRNMISGKCRERNMGIAGNTTTQMLARMSEILKYTPTVATIYGGINDQLQSIPTTTTQSNIQNIIDQLKAAGCTRIVICNIHTIPGASGASDGNWASYRTTLQNLSTSNNLPFCDFHAVSLVEADYLSDKLHLSASGLVKLANTLKATLDAQGWSDVLEG